MSTHDSQIDHDSDTSQEDSDASDANKRRDDTLTRIRSALLENRLSVVALSSENTGTDPYNSGVHRALAKAHVWSKRSR
jgi:hypothetical protein